MEDDDITDSISIRDCDWCIQLYNSEYSDYGLNVKFDELVALRDRLTEIIESRQSQRKRQPIKPKTGDEFNNSRQVAYGSYVKADPLKDK